MTVGWIDGSAGASGDMLLGALVDAGVPLALLQAAVDTLGVEPVRMRTEQVQRAGLGATRVHVEVAERAVLRTWSDVQELLAAARLDPTVRATALDVFERLAHAEATVHRVSPEQVHFHEVGALDALADVVGCAAGLAALGLSELTSSPLSLGSGTTRGAHGPLPVPAPAVLALLTGLPVRGGEAAHEMTTPTGAALLAATVSRWQPLPQLVPTRVGTGAGGRDPGEVANVLRLVLGEPAEREPAEGASTELLLQANVDDLDPRVWPGVLSALLRADAADAWLTPVLMKKGRPAHTLSVLCRPAVAAQVRRTVFRETTTLGLRETVVAKHALDRREVVVTVGGHRVRVKLGLLDGEVVHAMPEWDDVEAAAAALARPARQVLLEAHAQAGAHLVPPSNAYTTAGPPPGGSGPAA